MEEYILRRWTGNVRDPKSPKRYGKARGWKDILHDHLRNTRDTYFQKLAYEFEFNDDMLTYRHEKKKEMYMKNHVSLQMHCSSS